MRIRFGTSGWRGIIAREFTWEKVNLVADAIAAFLQEQGRTSLVVGGDCRFLSPELSESVADRMSGYGFEVVLARRPCPTPVLAHACRKRELGGIINFTASHNPPLYNGIKFSPWHGGPADGRVTSAIEDLIQSGREPVRGGGSVVVEDLAEDYVEDVRKYLNTACFPGSGLRAVYDAFSGTGSGILDRILVDLGGYVRVINAVRDPLFAGRQHPEPGEAGTEQLAREVTVSGAGIGLATDGDADRFGIVDENGVFVSPHDFLPLLLDYLVTEKGLRGRVVRSVTTGSLLDTVASHHGLETVVTPVGFKYLGAEMLKGGVLLAGEESGGLSITDHVPEKDGILACLLASEMVCARGVGLGEQLETLWERYGRMHVSRVDLRLDSALRRHIEENYFDRVPGTLADTRVLSVDRTDGVRMVLPDGDWVLIRLSGTEPLARIYAQSESSARRDMLLDRVTSHFTSMAEDP
jgi:phosphoglucomutase